MKRKEKQQFRSSGLLSLLGLIVLSLTIIATPWNRHIEDSKTQIALQKAEVVGYQVVQVYREAIKVSLSSDKESGRQPASAHPMELVENLRNTGTVGKDPWGQPYRYRILPPKNSNALKILVWSTGPNKKVESVELTDEQKNVLGQPSYSGDDLGVLLSMSQN